MEQELLTVKMAEPVDGESSVRHNGGSIGKDGLMKRTDMRPALHTTLGLRSLSLKIDAPRFELHPHLASAIYSLICWSVFGVFVVAGIDYVSPFLRAWLLGL